MTEPILKWAGGKRWLAPRIADLFARSSAARLVEPFAGGAAVFFRIRPVRTLLADNNAELIECYEILRRHPKALGEELAAMSIDSATFYEVRAARPEDPISRAARFIYLNRTAFNGLYRVNSRGDFNVPFGCKPETVMPSESRLLEVAVAQGEAELRAADYRETLARCGEGDFVYLDPPYTVRHNSNGFNRYNRTLFSWEDQAALAQLAAEVSARGATVVVSNADHESIRELYAPLEFEQFPVNRLTRMAASPDKRGRTTELLMIGRSVSRVW